MDGRSWRTRAWALALALGMGAWGCGDGGDGGDLPGADVPAEAAPADLPPGDAPGDLAPADAPFPDLPPGDAPADLPPGDAPTDGPGDLAPGDLPAPPPALHCVTARIPDPLRAHVVRVDVTPAAEGFALHLSDGDQHAYASGPRADPVAWQASATGTAGAGAADLEWDGGRLEASPSPDAPALLAGTLSLEGQPDLPAWCWAPGTEPPLRYDPATGACVDGDAPAAPVPLPLAYVTETRRGQCADLRTVALEDDDLYYPQLAGWDLRGADLRAAELHFADLLDARLEGADLEGISFGYARITGTVDAHTVLPDPAFGGSCTVTDGRVECFQ